MRIKSISYFDTDTKWNLSKVDFKSLTLLVGASGVGKTQILQSILRLRSIIHGESVSGTQWDIEFQTYNDYNYRWKGEFEQKGNSLFSYKDKDEDSEKNSPRIVFEKVWLNDEEIIDRNHGEIIFKGQKTVKLAQDKSALHHLKEEELISPAYTGFKRIIFSDQVESKKKPQKFNPDFLTIDKKLNKYNDIDSIRESDENIITKLYLAYKNAPEIIDSIKDRFIDIFPFILDLKIAPLDFKENDNTPTFLREIPFIQIKEKNVEDWIIQPQISSGMYRTLMHLCELYLCPEGTVILIDEFENSLGVNCIDELTMDLQNSSDRNLQFIITSHHPYIINQIHYKNWKLVTRKGSQVETRDAEKFVDFTKSKQEAFIQLTQLDEFTTGILEE